MRCLRRRTPYGPHHGSRKRQHHPRPRPSQSMPQPRQTLRAPSPTPSLCQSWEAILGRRPKTRGHAPRNGCHSHAKLCEHRLLRRLCASLGRLSWADARKHAATPLAMDATAMPNSASTVSCAVSVPVLGGYPSWADAREHRGQRAQRRRPRSDGHVDRRMTVAGKVPPLSLHK